VLLKARLGSEESLVSAVFKTATDPSVALGVSMGVTRRTGTGTADLPSAPSAGSGAAAGHLRPGFGVHLSLVKGGGVQYRKAVRGYQSPIATRQVVALEGVAASGRSENVEFDAFTDGPLSSAGLPAGRSKPHPRFLDP
jgi:hypothetical protein